MVDSDGELATAVVTVVLMPNGPLILSPMVQGADEKAKSTKQVVDEDIKSLLETPIRITKKKVATK